jgi:hypothetical protein
MPPGIGLFKQAAEIDVPIVTRSVSEECLTFRIASLTRRVPLFLPLALRVKL